jgi:beta-phosphoglucomutase-like phosphatase (HAD superfamily)
VIGNARAEGEIEAIVFDLDGVLVDSEEIWDEARQTLALERGLAWPESAQHAMMGMSSGEWSRYMHERVGLAESPEEISTEVVRRLDQIYRRHLPLLEGAVEAVERMSERFRLGLASSSNRPIIELVLELAGLLSASAAGMLVVAIPNPVFPPRPDALAAANIVLVSLNELTPELILRCASA